MYRVVWSLTAVAVFSCLLLAGCAPDFAPYWKIDKLRVMAIQADPVVARYLEPVTLSALVYAPQDEEIEYDWSWCPLRTDAQNNHECPINAEDLEELLAGGEDEDVDFGEDPFDLGQESEATFVNPFEAEQVRAFCEAIQRQILEEVDDPELVEFLPGGDCSRGYEISLRLEVSTAEDSIVASKRFFLWGGNEEEVNENPEFTELQVRPQNTDGLERLRDEAGWQIPAGADADDRWVAIPEDADLRVVAGIPLDIRALVDPESVLTYTPAPPVGQPEEEPEPREEAFVYRYFATSGSLGDSSHLYAPGENELDEASISSIEFSASELEENCPHVEQDGCGVYLWAVVRDARLGVDMMERRLLVQESDE